MKIAKMLGMMAVMGALFVLCGCGVTEGQICDTAKEIINEKLAENSKGEKDPLTCVSVKITKKISDNNWEGKATLSDNSVLDPVKIKYNENDSTVEVDLSEALGNMIAEAFAEAAAEAFAEDDE